MPDPSEGVGTQAGVNPIEPPSQPPRRSGLRRRVAASLLGLTATVLLSAYYLYQRTDSVPATGVMIERSAPASPRAPVVQSEGAPARVSGPSALAAVPPSPNRPKSDGHGAATASGIAVKGGTSPEASATRVQVVSKTRSAPPKAERVAASRDAGTLAGKPSWFDREVAAPLPRDAHPIAVQQTLAVFQPPRIAARYPTPALNAREIARRPAAARATGHWDRPCAEGVGLESTCVCG